MWFPTFQSETLLKEITPICTIKCIKTKTWILVKSNFTIVAKTHLS